MIFYVMAVVLLAITVRDTRREQTDTVFLFDWWAWFDVSRRSSPALYWLCISVQLLCVVGLIVMGAT